MPTKVHSQQYASKDKEEEEEEEEKKRLPVCYFFQRRPDLFIVSIAHFPHC